MERLSAQTAYDNLAPHDWDVCKTCGKVHFSSYEAKECIKDFGFNEEEDGR